MAPQPGSADFDPAKNCGLPLHEQDQYDAEVRGALGEIDRIFATLGITFEPVNDNLWEAGEAAITTEGI